MEVKERRECNGCGYHVALCIIDDGKTPQFMSTPICGEFAGFAILTDTCPKCGRELNLLSTRLAEEKHKSLMRRE
ncbi:MAG: hypothetical protein AAB343_02865 [Patescibacteria group bacterium]